MKTENSKSDVCWQCALARVARARAARLRRLAAARKMLPLRRLAARKLGVGTRPRGVNLVGYARAEMGLGTALRGMAAALEAAGEPFNIINLEAGNSSRHGDTSWAHKEVANSGYDVTIVGVHPDNSFMLKTRVPWGVLGASYVINVWYWELPELPDWWSHEFMYADEIWVGSRFVQSAVSMKSPVPVVRVQPVVRADAAETFARSHFGLPGGRFLFLAMFDTHSVLERKNPLAVLRAYKHAFPVPERGAGLVLKFNNPNASDPVARAAMEEVGGARRRFRHRPCAQPWRGHLAHCRDGLLRLAPPLGGLRPRPRRGDVPRQARSADELVGQHRLHDARQLGRRRLQARAARARLRPLRRAAVLGGAGRDFGRVLDAQALRGARTCARMGARGRETIKNEFSPEAAGA